MKVSKVQDGHQHIDIPRTRFHNICPSAQHICGRFQGWWARYRSNCIRQWRTERRNGGRLSSNLQNHSASCLDFWWSWFTFIFQEIAHPCPPCQHELRDILNDLGLLLGWKCCEPLRKPLLTASANGGERLSFRRYVRLCPAAKAGSDSCDMLVE